MFKSLLAANEPEEELETYEKQEYKSNNFKKSSKGRRKYKKEILKKLKRYENADSELIKQIHLIFLFLALYILFPFLDSSNNLVLIFNIVTGILVAKLIINYFDSFLSRRAQKQKEIRWYRLSLWKAYLQNEKDLDKYQGDLKRELLKKDVGREPNLEYIEYLKDNIDKIRTHMYADEYELKFGGFFMLKLKTKKPWKEFLALVSLLILYIITGEDKNSDGIYTISDIWALFYMLWEILKSIIFLPGNFIIYALIDTKLGIFLELTDSNINGYFSGFISFIPWFLVYSISYIIYWEITGNKKYAAIEEKVRQLRETEDSS